MLITIQPRRFKTSSASPNQTPPQPQRGTSGPRQTTAEGDRPCYADAFKRMGKVTEFKQTEGE